MKVANDIYEARLERGLTQAALGELAGMSAKTVLRIENEHRDPTPAELYDFAEALKADVVWGAVEPTGKRHVADVVASVVLILAYGECLREIEKRLDVEVRLRCR